MAASLILHPLQTTGLGHGSDEVLMPFLQELKRRHETDAAASFRWGTITAVISDKCLVRMKLAFNVPRTIDIISIAEVKGLIEITNKAAAPIDWMICLPRAAVASCTFDLTALHCRVVLICAG